MPEPRANPAPKISADPNDVTGYRRPGGKVRNGGGGSGLDPNTTIASLSEVAGEE